jgi:hypothetical protein
MPNSKPSRNAEYLSNAQLSQASSPKNRPLDSTKTQKIKLDWLPSNGTRLGPRSMISIHASCLNT